MNKKVDNCSDCINDKGCINCQDGDMKETKIMKTITDYANEYVGHSQEIDEDLSVYTCRVAYKAGMIKAFELIRHEINVASVNGLKFKILHLYDFMDKIQGRKEEEK